MEGKYLNKDQRLWLKERGKNVGRQGRNVHYIERNSILEGRFLKCFKKNGLKFTKLTKISIKYFTWM